MNSRTRASTFGRNVAADGSARPAPCPNCGTTHSVSISVTAHVALRAKSSRHARSNRKYPESVTTSIARSLAASAASGGAHAYASNAIRRLPSVARISRNPSSMNPTCRSFASGYVAVEQNTTTSGARRAFARSTAYSNASFQRVRCALCAHSNTYAPSGASLARASFNRRTRASCTDRARSVALVARSASSRVIDCVDSIQQPHRALAARNNPSTSATSTHSASYGECTANTSTGAPSRARSSRRARADVPAGAFRGHETRRTASTSAALLDARASRATEARATCARTRAAREFARRSSARRARARARAREVDALSATGAERNRRRRTTTTTTTTTRALERADADEFEITARLGSVTLRTARPSASGAFAWRASEDGGVPESVAASSVEEETDEDGAARVNVYAGRYVHAPSVPPMSRNADRGAVMLKEYAGERAAAFAETEVRAYERLLLDDDVEIEVDEYGRGPGMLPKKALPIARLVGYFASTSIDGDGGRSLWTAQEWHGVRRLSEYARAKQEGKSETKFWPPVQRVQDQPKKARARYVRRAFEQCLKGVWYAHQRGVAHGALDGSTFLCSTFLDTKADDLEVRLINFGCSTLCTPDKRRRRSESHGAGAHRARVRVARGLRAVGRDVG